MANPLAIAQFDQSYLDLIQAIQEAGGECSVETENELSFLVANMIRNVDSYIEAQRHFKSLIEYCDEMKDKFTKKKAAVEKEIDRFKSAMLLHMDAVAQCDAKGKLLQGELGKVRLMSLDVISEETHAEDLPAKYQSQTITLKGLTRAEADTLLAEIMKKYPAAIVTSMDKKALLADMKNELDGEDIAGEIRREMQKGQVYRTDNIPGAVMRVSRFPRIF